LEASITGEYKKPFTVGVKTTGRIDARTVDKKKPVALLEIETNNNI